MDEARSAETPGSGVEATTPVHWKVRRHWRRMGRAMHGGHLGRAERLAIRYLRKHPQDSTSWEVWGEVLRAREQHADEERILRRGLDFTGAPRLRFRLVQILASSGELEAARDLLDSFGREHLMPLLGSPALALAAVEVES